MCEHQDEDFSFSEKALFIFLAIERISYFACVNASWLIKRVFSLFPEEGEGGF